MPNKCDTCQIRIQCNECDRELTCEQFKEYWNKKTEQLSCESKNKNK